MCSSQVLPCILACFWILPMSWKVGLINWVFGKRKKAFRGRVPDCIDRAALNLLDPYCVANTTYMAHIEMQEVRRFAVLELGVVLR